MRSSANIRSVQALEDLKGALVRFGADAQMALSAAAMEIRRALEWLAERQSYWQGEVCRRDGIVAGARAALTACLASGDREHPPSRGAYQAALVQAQRRLGEAQAELRKLKQWSAAIHDALASYQREAQRLDALLGGDLPRASALLGRKIATLHDYAAISLPSRTGLPTGGPVFSGAAPSGVIAGFDGVGRREPAPRDVGADFKPAPTDDNIRPESGSAAGGSIRDVPLDRIDVRDTHVHDAADFKKVSHDELVEGFRKLEEVVRPGVREAADGDDFARLDAERGLDYEHGNRRVYDVADRAMDLAEAHGPRGYDAVHLAAALEVQAG